MEDLEKVLSGWGLAKSLLKLVLQLPRHYIEVWTVLAVAAAMFLVMSLAHLALVEARDTEVVSRIRREERASELLKLKQDSKPRYREISRTSDHIVLTEGPRHEPGILGPVSRNTLLINDVQIIYETIVIFENAGWTIGRDGRDDFVSETNDKIDLVDLFKRNGYQRTFGRATHVLCFGLASRESEQADNGVSLTSARADTLCDVAAEATGKFSRSFWRVALGRAIAVRRTDEEGHRQRSAIIVGIWGGPDSKITSIAPVIISDAEVISNVDLAGYEFSKQPHIEKWEPER